MDGNLGPIIECSHRSLVSIGTLLSALPASMTQRIARRELSIPHLEELNCTLSLDTFTDLKNMVEALWSNGEGGGDIRRVFRSRCKIASGSATGAEEVRPWEAEMRVLFERLSIEGEITFL